MASSDGVVKRVMYKKYLQAFIARTQNARLKSVIIDGFAGPGRYSNEWPEEIEKYCSPLIALMVALEDGWKKNKSKRVETTIHQEIDEDTNSNIEFAEDTTSHQEHPRPIFGWESFDGSPREELDKINKMKRGDCVDMDTNVSIILIVNDKRNYATLLCNIELLINKFLQRHFSDVEYNVTEDQFESKFSITMEPFSVSIEVLNQLFEEHEPPSYLLESNVRSLTFLDPFGYTHTPLSHVEKFAPGVGNEVMINFMSSYVNRCVKERPKLVGQLYGLDTADIEKDDELGRFIEHVIYESDNDTNGDKIERNNVQKCVDTYEQFLKFKISSNYSLVFEVRGKRNAILYHMVYFTNHIRGVEAMKTAMVKCSQQEGEMVMSDYDIMRKGMILNFQKRQNDRVVADIIFEKFKGLENVLVEPTVLESNNCGMAARKIGKRVYDMFPTVKEHVLLETNYCLWKRPLALLQKEHKIKKVTENGEPQKLKYRFPNKDANGQHIETRLWFEQDDSCLSNKENMEKSNEGQENTTQEQTSTAGTSDLGVGKRTRPKLINEYMLPDKFAGTSIPKETLIGCAKTCPMCGHEKNIFGNKENTARQTRKRGRAREEMHLKPNNEKKRCMTKKDRLDEAGERKGQRKIDEYYLQ